MNYFLDTEFNEDGYTILLLSIALVCEDGRELYLENSAADREIVNPFVRDHVLPYLHPFTCADDGHLCPLERPVNMRGIIRGFCGENPIFWGYYADYDWVALNQLYGPLISHPRGWPFYCRDFPSHIGKPRPSGRGGCQETYRDYV